jgi:hypothetical protein
MKYLIFIILLSVTSFASGQKKLDNTIVIRDVSFDSAIAKLIESGFTVRFIDKANKICYSNTAPLGTAIIIKTKTDGLYITANIGITYFNSDVTSNPAILSYYKSGYYSDRWQELMIFAGQFHNLEYLRQ